MFQTCEIRWFFPTTPFDRALLFDGNGVSGSVRTDWYATPSNPQCGIKLREGLLEPKLLLKDLGVQEMGPATGRVQSWAKWSADFPGGDFPPDELLAAAGWVAVAKHRFLRSFTCEGGRVAEVTSEAGAHCHFEWTELRVGSSRWWTVGLEAFGGDDLERVLSSVANHVFQRVAWASTFREENSYSYPEWLYNLASA